MTHSICNNDDIIDPRDVIARIEELKSQGGLDGDETAELESLRKLAAQGKPYAADWEHGAILIRETYFVQYAQDLSDDLGGINHSAVWPFNHIDWESAARGLKMDYTEIDFDGVAYYTR